MLGINQAGYAVHPDAPTPMASESNERSWSICPTWLSDLVSWIVSAFAWLFSSSSSSASEDRPSLNQREISVPSPSSSPSPSPFSSPPTSPTTGSDREFGFDSDSDVESPVQARVGLSGPKQDQHVEKLKNLPTILHRYTSSPERLKDAGAFAGVQMINEYLEPLKDLDSEHYQAARKLLNETDDHSKSMLGVFLDELFEIPLDFSDKTVRDEILNLIGNLSEETYQYKTFGDVARGKSCFLAVERVFSQAVREKSRVEAFGGQLTTLEGQIAKLKQGYLAADKRVSTEIYQKGCVKSLERDFKALFGEGNFRKGRGPDLSFSVEFSYLANLVRHLENYNQKAYPADFQNAKGMVSEAFKFVMGTEADIQKFFKEDSLEAFKLGELQKGLNKFGFRQELAALNSRLT